MGTATQTDAGEQALAALLARVADGHPDLAHGAAAELERTLQATRRSAVGPLAWQASCLTATGAPLEVAVTSARTELRTTVDVLAPEDDRRGALDECLRLAAAFGSDGADAGALALLRRHQRTGVLRWGAWLGSRHRADGTTRHKLYVELVSDPVAARAVVDSLAPSAGRVLPPAPRLRFVGLPLDGGAGVEVYARPGPFDAADAAAVVGRAGFPLGAATKLLTAAGLSWPGGDRPTRNAAMSVAADGDDISAVALFTFTHARFGRDSRARRRLLAAADAGSWPSAELYAAISRPLAAATGAGRPCHTVVSDVVTAAGDVERHIALAPPPTGLPPASDPVPARHEGERK
jgi:hypothetical protein